MLSLRHLVPACIQGRSSTCDICDTTVGLFRHHIPSWYDAPYVMYHSYLLQLLLCLLDFRPPSPNRKSYEINKYVSLLCGRHTSILKALYEKHSSVQLDQSIKSLNLDETEKETFCVCVCLCWYLESRWIIKTSIFTSLKFLLLSRNILSFN